MRTLCISLMIGILAACASSGGFLEYKPAHWVGADWAITGMAEHGADADTVFIKVNDSTVITGKLSPQNPEDEFTGSFQDYTISARCKLVNASHNCAVSVDDKAIGQLSF